MLEGNPKDKAQSSTRAKSGASFHRGWKERTTLTPAPLPAAPATQRRVQKNMTTAMPVYEDAHRLLGVDLSRVPGLSGGVLCVLMSELGTATHIRAKFRSAEAFASWLGLCPDNRISGGRILKAGTWKVTNRISNILRMAANALSREQGRMGEFVRRFQGRLGKAEGIVVGAHKLARIIWAMIVSGQPYDEAKAFHLTAASAARRLKNLQNQAKAMNMSLVPVSQLTASVIQERPKPVPRSEARK